MTSLTKAARVVDLISEAGAQSAADIAGAIGVDRSTAWRIARSLEELGWLRRDPLTRRYGIGLRLFEIGSRALDFLDVRAEAREVMRGLVAETGESADLAVRDGRTAVFFDKVDGTHEIRAFTRIGERVPLHAVAVGKVFLAFMPDEERELYLGGDLSRQTATTITDAKALLAVLRRVRELGWAINCGELRPEAGGLAVPLFDRAGRCVAALGLNIPMTRLQDENVDRLVRPLVKAGKRLSGISLGQ